MIDRLGFSRALAVAALALLAVLLAVVIGVMRRCPEELGLHPDGEVRPPARSVRPVADRPRPWGDALTTWHFWSVSAPFALGLVAQVGVLTHLVPLVTPALGGSGAAQAVSATTAAALIGRLATGFVVDRVNRRLVASATLLVQIAGLAVLMHGSSAVSVYVGCALFGLGVGNLTTLPGLILAVEWPRERFAALVALVVGINQFTFAFGPSLVGVMRDRAGTYGPALGACAVLQAVAAAIILLGPGGRRGLPRSGRGGREVSDGATCFGVAQRAARPSK